MCKKHFGVYHIILYRKENNHEPVWDLNCGWVFTLIDEECTLFETNRIYINFLIYC